MTEKVGEISAEVVKTLGLSIPANTSVYVGRSNIAHMVQEHNEEYWRYYDKISLILSLPDYVRVKKDDDSIEYIKFFSKHVKLAVRVAGDGEYYARSLYYIEANRVENLVKTGELKSLDKK